MRILAVAFSLRWATGAAWAGTAQLLAVLVNGPHQGLVSFSGGGRIAHGLLGVDN